MIDRPLLISIFFLDTPLHSTTDVPVSPDVELQPRGICNIIAEDHDVLKEQSSCGSYIYG